MKYGIRSRQYNFSKEGNLPNYTPIKKSNIKKNVIISSSRLMCQEKARSRWHEPSVEIGNS